MTRNALIDPKLNFYIKTYPNKMCFINVDEKITIVLNFVTSLWPSGSLQVRGQYAT